MGAEERRMMELEIKIDKITRDIKSLERDKSELEASLDKIEKPEDILLAKQKIEEIKVRISRLRNERAVYRRELERMQ